MTSRYMDLERRTLLVQFIAVDPLTFFATSDGTDLVQDILKAKLARADADIIGQEGSLSINDNAEFLTFEPTDTKNRTLHLPVEHLAYCGALRRMRRDTADQRNPDQIIQRDFENVDLANRYAHRIIGPPVFVAVFHGFDNALCYTFITQSADDACLLVLKLMRAFNHCEQQQLDKQGQAAQGLAQATIACAESPSTTIITQGAHLSQPAQTMFVGNKQILSAPNCIRSPNTGATVCLQEPCHDDLIQRLLSNPNLQIVNQPYGPTPVIANRINATSILAAPPPAVSPNNLQLASPGLTSIVV